MLAFTILAVGLGLLLSFLSNGVHAIARASDSTRASLYAQSLLDSLGADGRLKPGDTSGEFEHRTYLWSMHVELAPTPPTPQAGGIVAPQGGPADNQLLHVVLTMQWKGGASGNRLRIETLRAYTAPQEIAQ